MSSKVRSFPSKTPALTDLVYLVDALVASGGNYKADLQAIFIASGIFYVPVGVPNVALGAVGNFAFRGDGTLGSYLYHKISVGGTAIRRPQRRYMAHTNRHIFRRSVWPQPGGAVVISWNPIY